MVANSRRVLNSLYSAGALIAVLILISLLIAAQPTDRIYLSPLPDARFVSKGTSIAVRYGPELDERQIAGLEFAVTGEQSGDHSGRVVLADDRRTVIFYPDREFTPGEQVQVEIGRMQPPEGTAYRALTFSFTVGLNQTYWSPEDSDEQELPEMEVAFPDALTLPDDIPNFSVTANPDATAEGYIFVAPYQWLYTDVGSYLLIVDDQGEIVYYQSVADDVAAYDFKKQPDGRLTYFSQDDGAYYVLDQTYQVVDRYPAGNGYRADIHDFQLLPNGNVMLMIYDSQQVDMSRFVRGGDEDAQVIGLVIQEIDPAKNVVFEWRSWDHMNFHDSPVDLTPEEADTDIDYVHGNSLDLDRDGNIVLSSRNLHEVTKIDRQTGEIIWRLGGRANMFAHFNDPLFGHQHDARVQPNGNITVFDNLGRPGPSRGVEYAINERMRTVTRVWEYAHNPPVFGAFMGNAQRLPNGNTLLSWGAPSREEEFAYVSITEVTPEGEVAFELTFDPPFVSYRAFRFPWQGFPNDPPDLAFRAEGETLTLGYSWNGATEVAGYKVFGGSTSPPDRLLEEKERTGFETQSVLTGLPPEVCYFQVVPVDAAGNDLTPSAVISTDPVACPPER